MYVVAACGTRPNLSLSIHYAKVSGRCGINYDDDNAAKSHARHLRSAKVAAVHICEGDSDQQMVVALKIRKLRRSFSSRDCASDICITIRTDSISPALTYFISCHDDLYALPRVSARGLFWTDIRRFSNCFRCCCKPARPKCTYFSADHNNISCCERLRCSLNREQNNKSGGGSSRISSHIPWGFVAM